MLRLLLLCLHLPFIFTQNYLTLFGGKLKVWWAVNTFDSTITMTFSTSKDVGWVGIGFKMDGKSMDKGDIIICYLDNNNSARCNDYTGNGYKVLLDTSVGGNNDILKYDGAIQNGRKVYAFIRNLNTADALDFPIFINDAVPIVFAYGVIRPSSDSEIPEHAAIQIVNGALFEEPAKGQYTIQNAFRPNLEELLKNTTNATDNSSAKFYLDNMLLIFCIYLIIF
jgi:hypothetical protein